MEYQKAVTKPDANPVYTPGHTRETALHLRNTVHKSLDADSLQQIDIDKYGITVPEVLHTSDLRLLLLPDSDTNPFVFTVLMHQSFIMRSPSTKETAKLPDTNEFQFPVPLFDISRNSSVTIYVYID